MPDVIQPQVNCSNAKEFLDVLSPFDPFFKDTGFTQPWLFRGQGRDDPLIPSLFRKDKDDKLPEFTSLEVQRYGQRLLAERDILVQFFDMADKRGLALPDDSQELRNIIEIFDSARGDEFIAKGFSEWNLTDTELSILLSLTALAQHYGLPTRLLDWTRLPLAAAYFAGEGPYQHSGGDLSKPIVVWAFYFPLFGKHDASEKKNDPIRIVTAPSASNPNLKAQQGVFTLVNPQNSKEAYGDYKPFDQLLSEMAARANEGSSQYDRMITECKLRKYTLPASESSELLYLLAKLDITPSTVYPGFGSVVNDLRMRKKFQEAGLI